MVDVQPLDVRRGRRVSRWQIGPLGDGAEQIDGPSQGEAADDVVDPQSVPARGRPRILVGDAEDAKRAGGDGVLYPRPVTARARSAERVVVYTEATGRGGAEVSLRNLLTELDASLDVVVLGVDEAICSWIAEVRPGTPVAVAAPVRGKWSLGALLALRRRIAQLQPTIFHANLRTIGDAQYALLAALSLRSLNVVAVEQLPYPTRLAACRGGSSSGRAPGWQLTSRSGSARHGSSRSRPGSRAAASERSITACRISGLPLGRRPASGWWSEHSRVSTRSRASICFCARRRRSSTSNSS